MLVNVDLRRKGLLAESLFTSSFLYSDMCERIYLPPATKFGQGYVFTGVCYSVNGGCLPQCMLGYHTPRDQAPSLGADPIPGPDTPREQIPPGTRHPPGPGTPQQQTPPSTGHAGRYGQRAGGTHPTGMQSCSILIFKKWNVVACIIILIRALYFAIALLTFSNRLVIRRSI